MAFSTASGMVGGPSRRWYKLANVAAIPEPIMAFNSPRSMPLGIESRIVTAKIENRTIPVSNIRKSLLERTFIKFHPAHYPFRNARNILKSPYSSENPSILQLV